MIELHRRITKQQGRSYRGGEWGVTPPLLLKILFFLNAKIEKSTFSGVYSCSIYMKKGITPPLLLKFRYHRIYAPPALETQLRPCEAEYEEKSYNPSKSTINRNGCRSLCKHVFSHLTKDKSQYIVRTWILFLSKQRKIKSDGFFLESFSFCIIEILRDVRFIFFVSLIFHSKFFCIE